MKSSEHWNSSAWGCSFGQPHVFGFVSFNIANYTVNYTVNHRMKTMNSALSSARYTECVDRLNSVLGRVSRYLDQVIKQPYTQKPKFTTIDAEHRIVKCGKNVYKYSSNPAGVVEILIWKDGWQKVICAYDDRSVSEIIENFEWEAQP